MKKTNLLAIASLFLLVACYPGKDYFDPKFEKARIHRDNIQSPIESVELFEGKYLEAFIANESGSTYGSAMIVFLLSDERDEHHKNAPGFTSEISDTFENNALVCVKLELRNGSLAISKIIQRNDVENANRDIWHKGTLQIIDLNPIKKHLVNLHNFAKHGEVDGAHRLGHIISKAGPGTLDYFVYEIEWRSETGAIDTSSVISTLELIVSLSEIYIETDSVSINTGGQSEWDKIVDIRFDDHHYPHPPNQ